MKKNIKKHEAAMSEKRNKKTLNENSRRKKYKKPMDYTQR